METRDFNYLKRKYGYVNLHPPDGEYEAVLVRVTPEIGYEVRLFFELTSSASLFSDVIAGAHYIVNERFPSIRPDFRNDQRYLCRAAEFARFMQDWTGIALDMSVKSKLRHDELIELLTRHVGMLAILTVQDSVIDDIRPGNANRSAGGREGRDERVAPLPPN